MTKISEDVLKNILNKNTENTEDAVDSINIDDIESFGNQESIKRIYESIHSYNQMLAEKITFITPELSDKIPFTRENLYLICGYSGHGKSTLAANISYPLWQQGKKTLVISNEEPEQDVLFRIACIKLGHNFNDYKKGNMPHADQKECAKLFPEISKCVKIVDVNAKNGLTTKLEGIKHLLEQIQSREDYSCAMIDYFQLVKTSVSNTKANTYEVLDDLRRWLGRYIKNSRVPIVIFAQLHSVGKRGKELDSRIKECPAIYETSTVVLEAVPNFELKTTDLIVHKDRFGLTGHKAVFGFDRGRFISMDKDEVEKLIQQAKLKEIKGAIEIDDEPSCDP